MNTNITMKNYPNPEKPIQIQSLKAIIHIHENNELTPKTNLPLCILNPILKNTTQTIVPSPENFVQS